MARQTRSSSAPETVACWSMPRTRSWTKPRRYWPSRASCRRICTRTRTCRHSAAVSVPLSTLTPARFLTLADVPPEIEWFAKLTNANTRRAYRQGIADFMAFAGLRQPEQFRHVTRAYVIAWHNRLVSQGLANDTIRHKLAALSSLYAYL